MVQIKFVIASGTNWGSAKILHTGSGAATNDPSYVPINPNVRVIRENNFLAVTLKLSDTRTFGDSSLVTRPADTIGYVKFDDETRIYQMRECVLYNVGPDLILYAVLGSLTDISQ